MGSQNTQSDAFEDGEDEIFMNIDLDSAVILGKDESKVVQVVESNEQVEIEKDAVKVSSAQEKQPQDDIQDEEMVIVEEPKRTIYSTPLSDDSFPFDGCDDYFLDIPSQINADPTADDVSKPKSPQKSPSPERPMEFVQKPLVQKVLPVIKKVTPSRASTSDTSSSLWSRKPIKADDRPIVFREGMTSEEAKKHYKNAPVIFLDDLTENVTHFVFDCDQQVGVFKTFNMYKAIARGIFVLHPNWLNTLITPSRVAFTDESGYTRDQVTSDKLKVESVTAKSGGIFDGYKFIFSRVFRLDCFVFSTEQLMDLVSIAGGIASFTNVGGSPSKIIRTFVVATSVGVHKTKCTKYYNDYGWIVIHPQFILDSLWKNEVTDVPTHQLFTPSMLLKKSF